MTTLGDIYRRAAERVGDACGLYGCCCSVWVCLDTRRIDHFGDIYRIFAPCDGYDPDKHFWPLNEAHRPVRVTALLLMAAMADAGDL